MTKPLISIITPCYNAASFLKQSIASVLSQTYPYFEWILVNDGSTDETEIIIQTCSDTRIRYYKQENKGQCAASNFGLSKASGDYIKFLDADDLLDVDYLNAMVNRLMTLPDIEREEALILSRWQRFSGEDNLWPIVYRPEWMDSSPLEFIKKALGNGPDMLPAWQWLIPIKILRKSGGWNEDLGLGNDFEFSTRLILASSGIKFCNQSIVFYRSDLLQNMSSDTSMKTIISVLKSARLGITTILKHSNEYNIRQVCADKLQIWLITYYPYIDQYLTKNVESEIRALGGSNANVEWGLKMKFLNMLMGWKTSRMVQFYYYKLRYKCGYKNSLHTITNTIATKFFIHNRYKSRY
jgi:glycosyltransferase involved in cell wall biosynthesis